MSTQKLDSLAELVCGCALRDGAWRFCPLHAQAEGMYKFLLQLSMAGVGNLHPLGYWVEHARALLRKVEGRETP